MWIATVRCPSGWLLQSLDGAGRLTGEPWVAQRLGDVRPTAATGPGPTTGPTGENGPPPRHVWTSTAGLYPAVLAAGDRVERCHDLRVIGNLLERGSSLADDPAGAVERMPGEDLTLFDGDSLFTDDAQSGRPSSGGAGEGAGQGAGAGSSLAPGPAPVSSLEEVAAEFARQRALIEARRTRFAGFGLLVAAESACTLAAAEMTAVGLPWSAEAHDRVLEAALGPRPRANGRPARMQELADRVAAELGAPGLNPDSLPDLLRALHRAGIPVRTTRAHELRTVRHPAIEPLLRYRELARLFAANGWAWREQWAPDGRFRPEYVPAGVVSGRWATRGGGALQIPKSVREAVLADPGHRLVVADAGQLEPRVLAALSGDAAMMAVAASSGDLYAAVARELFGTRRTSEDPLGLRHDVKIALLSAMYGGGTASPALAALRRRFPDATALLENAAGEGETGGIVHSVLGRPCPGPPPGWFNEAGEGVDRATARARSRGRFTRNFVIQASAADWANVLVAVLRRELTGLPRHGTGADLVFFVHDEIVVHTPEDLTDDAVAALGRAGREATRLVLGERAPAIPLEARVVRCYADPGRPPATAFDPAATRRA